ncbi:MAG: type II toxin-antitoxin system death-on-curing family toxin [Chloroflexaceae bacterium]|nr:type II toxin-antitoxin system death-on-curing family toxin [Chloroflexaceae bacterium]
MRYLEVEDLLMLHRQIIAQSGGSTGLRDIGMLASATAQPRQTFGGQDLHPSIAQKAAALGFSLICNHPFIDGNKRTGHAAMETFLVLNGYEIAAPVDEQEQMVLAIAAGACDRETLAGWVERHLVRRGTP